MNAYLHYFFRQLGDHPTQSDLQISCRVCTAAEAQEECNELNSLNDGYFYFMDADDVKRENGY